MNTVAGGRAEVIHKRYEVHFPKRFFILEILIVTLRPKADAKYQSSAMQSSISIFIASMRSKRATGSIVYGSCFQSSVSYIFGCCLLVVNVVDLLLLTCLEIQWELISDTKGPKK